MELIHTGALDEYGRRTGTEVVGERMLVSRGPDWRAAWRQLFL